jgi:hypothetical protein
MHASWHEAPSGSKKERFAQKMLAVKKAHGGFSERMIVIHGKLL